MQAAAKQQARYAEISSEVITSARLPPPGSTPLVKEVDTNAETQPSLSTHLSSAMWDLQLLSHISTAKAGLTHSGGEKNHKISLARITDQWTVHTSGHGL